MHAMSRNPASQSARVASRPAPTLSMTTESTSAPSIGRSTATTARPRSRRGCTALFPAAEATTTPAMFSDRAMSRKCSSLAASPSVLHRTTEYPASWAVSATPRAREVKKGFSMSGIISATTSESCRRSVRAMRLGV